jgi:hypothetical protein
VAGDAAERGRVGVVDFAGQEAPAARIIVHRPRRRRQRLQRRRQAEGRDVRATGGRDPVELLRERRPAAVGCEKRQEDEAEVAVIDLDRGAYSSGSCRSMFELAPGAGRPVDQARRQPRGVLEKIVRAAVGAAPVREEGRDGPVEPKRRSAPAPSRRSSW